MEKAARLARFGNRVLDKIVILIVLFLFLYGGYSLWDTYMNAQGAFLSDDLLQYKPSGDGDTLSLADLMKINPDVVGWLTVDNTHIDYPVVQGENDMEYVNKDVYGEFSLSGSIFLSCLNKRDFSDPYSLVYGHHMANGGMFGDVVSFTKKDYFDKHKTGTLYLPDQTMQVDLFACVKTSASDSVVYSPQEQKEDASGLLSYIKKNALFFRDISVGKEDRIIGLSTCSESVTNGRVILFGKLTDKKQNKKQDKKGGTPKNNEKDQK